MTTKKTTKKPAVKKAPNKEYTFVNNYGELQGPYGSLKEVENEMSYCDFDNDDVVEIYEMTLAKKMKRTGWSEVK